MNHANLPIPVEPPKPVSRHELVKSATLITMAGGAVALSQDQRRQIAIFDNGVVFVTKGKRFTLPVKTATRDAAAAGFECYDWHEVEAREIVDIYSKVHAGGGHLSSTTLKVERQENLRNIIEEAAKAQATDIHIYIQREYTEIRLRVFGRMQDFDTLDPDEGKAMIRAAFAVGSDLGSSTSELALQQGALTRRSQLLPHGVEMIRMQYSPTSEGRGALVMRLKYRGKADETDIDSLGYNKAHTKDIAVMRRRTNGLYLLSGKVSSGKSTTLQRTINKMYAEKRREISLYGIEEPIELELPGAIQVAAKVQNDGSDFIPEIKASLRSDPNVIVLGEIRSHETAGQAIGAAMAGFAVWSTIHAGSALGILDRLIDLGVESWKLADPHIVRGLVYQRLIGVICKECRITHTAGLRNGEIDPELSSRLCDLFGLTTDEMYLRGAGCSCCHNGLTGRTVVAETIQTDPTLLDHFRQGDRVKMRSHWMLPKSEGGMGGLPVLHHALAKAGAGISDINEVEEEVDLLDSYERDYSHLKDQLREDVADLMKKEK